MKARTLSYLTTVDLDIRGEDTANVADWMDVTYGDAQLTLVSADGFALAVERVLGAARAKTVRAAIRDAELDYIAFPG